MTPTFSNRATFRPARAAVNATATPAAKSPCCCPTCVGLECLDRTRYFAGQLLTEADLNNEQSYLLAKNRLHNRYLIGSGVVCGLQVVCGECDGWVTIKPGYAIDPCGNDIIVCADQPFNVVQAIQACCTPQKPADCSSLRAAPPPNCQDAEQKWCITIQYDEQPSRPVTPLRPSKTASGCGCGCGCGGSSKGGCGCKGSGASSGTACCCSSGPSVNATAATPGCEPTRILEGFKLGVCPVPPETQTNATGVSSNFVGKTNPPRLECVRSLTALFAQAPSLQGSDAQNYSAVCNYLALVRKTIASGSFVSCALIDELNTLQVPKPGPNVPNYTAQLQAVVDAATALLKRLALDCICLALLPTCPPDSCTNCLILACVTVRNGKIVDICHFGGGRQQVITFPAIQYWLNLLGADKFVTILIQALETICCNGNADRLLFAGMMQPQSLSSNGFSNPAVLNHLFSTMFTESLGAPLINGIAPALRVLDVRPLVGQPQAQVQRQLEVEKVSANFVDAGPAWLDTSVEAGQLFSPSAHPAGQPLTVYTNQGTVVGFEATSAADSLKLQVAALQKQVDGLQSRLDNSRPTRTR